MKTEMIGSYVWLNANSSGFPQTLVWSVGHYQRAASGPLGFPHDLSKAIVGVFEGRRGERRN